MWRFFCHLSEHYSGLLTIGEMIHNLCLHMTEKGGEEEGGRVSGRRGKGEGSGKVRRERAGREIEVKEGKKDKE